MKRLFFFSILWVAVLLLPGIPVLAQTEQKVRGAKAWEIRGLNHDSIIAAFGRRFVVLDSLMRSDVEVDRAMLFADTPHMQQVDSAFEAKEAYERKAFKRKHGLELTGQAYYRLDDQLGFDEDDQYSRYKAKFQGELGWNLFNSSFLQRKPQLRLISLNNQADRLHHLRQNARPLWDDAREAIEQRYNRLTAAVLREVPGTGLIVFRGGTPRLVQGSRDDLAVAFPRYARECLDGDGVPDAPIAKANIFVRGSMDETRRLVALLNDEVDGLDFDVPQPMFSNVMPSGWNKGAALAWLCDYLGVARDEAVVFGDAGNDVPIFEQAVHSVAVSGALPEAVSAARWHIGACEDDAVAQAIEALAAGEWPFDR